MSRRYTQTPEVGDHSELARQIGLSVDSTFISSGESKPKNWPRRLAAIGGISLALFAGGWKFLDKSGEDFGSDPLVNQGPNPDSFEVRIGTYNLQSKGVKLAPYTMSMIRKYRLDAVNLQEVSMDDAPAMERYFNRYGWSAKGVVADGRQDPTRGGEGIMTLTPSKPRDIDKVVFKGTSFFSAATRTVKGALEDAAHNATVVPLGALDAITGTNTVKEEPSFTNARDGLKANRVAMAETIDVKLGGKKIPLRIINTHLPNHQLPGLYKKNYKALLKFLDGNASKNLPVAICADFNTEAVRIEPSMGDHAFLTAEANDSTPSTSSGRQIDNCASHSAGVLGRGGIQSYLKPNGVNSDHNFTITTIPLKLEE